MAWLAVFRLRGSEDFRRGFLPTNLAEMVGGLSVESSFQMKGKGPALKEQKSVLNNNLEGLSQRRCMNCDVSCER